MKKEKMTELLKGLLDSRAGNGIAGDESEALKEAIEMLSSEYEYNDARDCIRVIMKREGISQSRLAALAGSCRQNVSQMLTRGSGMRTVTFQKIIGILGYETIVRKRDRK